MINIIQDLATPHNNQLIKELAKAPGVGVRLWYAAEKDPALYQWSTNITHEIMPANIYGKSFNWRFVLYCVKNRNEKFLLIGWMNINTKLIHLIFFMLRRPFNHWTDNPVPVKWNFSPLKWAMSHVSYGFLKYSNSKIFCVGKTAVNFFLNKGFCRERLVNLPIFVSCNISSLSKGNNDGFFSSLKLPNDKFVVSAGSRLIYDKGYDLLVRAVALMRQEIRSDIMVVMVGEGDAKLEIAGLIDEYGLSDQFIMIDWLEISEFRSVIFNSNVYVHPARFDAYGGTVLAMSLGVPVIGSNGAGAAVDRIKDGVNGFLYEVNDVQSLAARIEWMYTNPSDCKKMGGSALRTACEWPVSRGVEIICSNLV